VKGGDKLDLGGGHVMEFVMAPNLHWPDTMFSFDHGTGGLEGFGREGGG
jgi:flavorubredoxin